MKKLFLILLICLIQINFSQAAFGGMLDAGIVSIERSLYRDILSIGGCERQGTELKYYGPRSMVETILPEAEKNIVNRNHYMNDVFMRSL